MSDDGAVSWLTGLVLGAGEVMEQGRTLQGCITGACGTSYALVNRLGRTSRYNLYHCKLADGRYGVFKIASSADFNDDLDREGFVLATMAEKAEELEAGNTTSKPYNFDCFFPRLVESFIAQSQNGRRANVLDFADSVKDGLNHLTPIADIWEKDKTRVDPRTIAWILGKTLKVLSFAHDQGISNGFVSGSNILLERDQHGVILFDWTLSELNPHGRVPELVASQEIADAAKLAIRALGGDPTTGSIPESEQLTDPAFARYIWQLAQGRESDALIAHDRFYELVFKEWPRKFHPYTAVAL